MAHLRQTALIPLLLAGFTLALPAWSQSPDRQDACQKQASEKGLRSGPERMAFMRECVHGIAPAAAAPTKPATPAETLKPAKPAMPAAAKEPEKSQAAPPLSRMKECKQLAKKKSLHGHDRQEFMSSCMQAK